MEALAYSSIDSTRVISKPSLRERVFLSDSVLVKSVARHSWVGPFSLTLLSLAFAAMRAVRGAPFRIFRSASFVVVIIFILESLFEIFTWPSFSFALGSFLMVALAAFATDLVSFIRSRLLRFSD